MQSSASDDARPGRRRRIVLVIAAVVVAAGLLVHFTTVGSVADFVADALYAVLVYLVLALFLTRLRPVSLAGTAYALCALIELAQLTGVPATLAALFPPVRLLLGTTFAPLDLLAYAVGVAGALLTESLLRLRRTPREVVRSEG